MGRVAALGEGARVAGLALAGAVVLVADDPEAVRRGWRSLPDGVDLVILTLQRPRRWSRTTDCLRAAAY